MILQFLTPYVYDADIEVVLGTPSQTLTTGMNTSTRKSMNRRFVGFGG